MLLLLQQFGVASAVALAVPIVIRVNMTFVNLLGGVIYFFDAGTDKTGAWSDQAAEQLKDEQHAALQQPPPAGPSNSAMEN